MGKYPVEQLTNLVSEDKVLFDEPMSAHTTFRVGGPAEALVMVSDFRELRAVLGFAQNFGIPYTFIGNGSNILVSDEGVEGVVIMLKNSEYEVTPEYLEDNRAVFKVPAGVSLSLFAKQAAKLGFAGTEFAAGIPGSVGGGVAMNAGAYGGEIKDIIASATVLDKKLNKKVLSKEELELGYRTSAVLVNEYIVLEAEFILEKGDAENSLAIISDLNSRRRDKQPLEYPSAGSTFKRPEGYFAGKLIQDAGLAGFSVGGAMVSKKHCGFVINHSNATAKDIYRLIELVQQKVYEQFGVTLETEVRLLGDFSYAEI
ncbi:MAG: UDP-N-acetylmuramate dehydrogenase [Lachnospiraceae bacterium]|nr:UDP-N-acetylmuramate dehydrogenase [Lachnospiraceae bacterium]